MFIMHSGCLYDVPETKKVRYIIHSDAKNEADDQYTIAHILMTPKLDVRAIIGGHFNLCDDRYPQGKTAQASLEEIQKILALMKLDDINTPVAGAELPLENINTPRISAGAEKIIQEAMREDDRPLYIGLQGSLTDLASAILMEPRICQRMTAIWVGGGCYPNGGEEFNLRQDAIAAEVVFSSDMALWQIPRDAYQQFAVSLSELQWKVSRYGAIGKYLFEQLLEVNEREAGNPNWPNGETWILGDEGAIAPLLMDCERTRVYETRPAPRIMPDLSYQEDMTRRPIRVYHTMDNRMVLEDFFAKLAIQFPKTDR